MQIGRGCHAFDRLSTGMISILTKPAVIPPLTMILIHTGTCGGDEAWRTDCPPEQRPVRHLPRGACRRPGQANRRNARFTISKSDAWAMSPSSAPFLSRKAHRPDFSLSSFVLACYDLFMSLHQARMLCSPYSGSGGRSNRQCGGKSSPFWE
jgi:hypothetical protein